MVAETKIKITNISKHNNFWAKYAGFQDIIKKKHK
jgi:hypothetical protein